MSEHGIFLFADLAGFTALTEAHGDEEAANLAGSLRHAGTEYFSCSLECVKAFADEPSQYAGHLSG